MLWKLCEVCVSYFRLVLYVHNCGTAIDIRYSKILMNYGWHVSNRCGLIVHRYPITRSRYCSLCCCGANIPDKKHALYIQIFISNGFCFYELRISTNV